MSDARPLLVANSPLRWTVRLSRMAAAANPLLAADGGADHLARIGLRPQAVIGDLDSISDRTRGWLGDETMAHRPDQDRTDLEKSLDYAFTDLGLTELSVLAAVGGRSDHEVGNLGLLARYGMGEDLLFEGHDWRALAVAGQARLAAAEGETWSFWTYDPAVRVTIEGVRWPVHSAPLAAHDRPSISNQAVAREISVTADGGSVVVFRHLLTVGE
jgi:thiamine pyrophosphokinase